MKKLFVSALFLGFGAFAMAQQTPTAQQKAQWEARKAENFQKRDEMQKQHLAKMQQELNLSPAQVAQIQALHDRDKAERDANWQKNASVRNAKMQEMKNKKAAREAEMKRILTPDQYAKWQAKRQEMMQKRGEKFGKFHGKGMRDGQYAPVK